jgi:hypothetical protein
MAAIGVTGAVFTVQIGATQYEDQITSGTINTTPTVVRTKTLSGVAFDQTDLNSTMGLDFLFDEASGMYGALQTAIAGALPVAVVIKSTTGVWTGTSMYIESADLTYPSDGVAMVSTSFTGSVTFTAAGL